MKTSRLQIATVWLLAGLGCGGPVGPARDAGASDGSVPYDGGPPVFIDAGPIPDGGPVQECVGLPGVTLENVGTPLHGTSGVLHPSTRTLVSLPQGLAP